MYFDIEKPCICSTTIYVLSAYTTHMTMSTVL